MSLRALRIVFASALTCATVAVAAAGPAGATSIVRVDSGTTTPIPGNVASGVWSDNVDGNYFAFYQVYKNDTASNIELLTMEVVMLNPEDLGFGDGNPGNRDAIVGAAEAAYPGFAFTTVFHPTLNLAPVNWVRAEATVSAVGKVPVGGTCSDCGGTNYTLFPGGPATALSPTLLLRAPLLNVINSNFTVTFKTRNDLLGTDDVNNPDLNDWGELVLGVRFTPEPSTAVLFGGGLLGLIAARRRVSL